jgi:transposase-like protein
MNQEKKNKREKRVYDEAFRREAVALQSSDEPLVQIAAGLGVSQWNLRDWRKQYGDSSGSRKPSKSAAALGAIGTGALAA